MPNAFGPDGLVAYVGLDEFDVPTVGVRRVPEGVRLIGDALAGGQVGSGASSWERLDCCRDQGDAAIDGEINLGRTLLEPTRIVVADDRHREDAPGLPQRVGGSPGPPLRSLQNAAKVPPRHGVEGHVVRSRRPPLDLFGQHDGRQLAALAVSLLRSLVMGDR